MTSSKINYQRPVVLSIGGYDPSGGAGVIADAKTFEKHRVLGVCATTCITIQHESVFEKVYWLTQNQIKEQLEILFRVYKIEVVKIGLIENFIQLQWLVKFLKQQNTSIKIIVDPILKSSSGFDFHSHDVNKWITLVDSIDLFTPNYVEAQILFQHSNPDCVIANLHSTGAILLKNVPLNNTDAVDWLFENSNRFEFATPRLLGVGFEKHGSGCILSAAIAANLALQISLPKSCRKAKIYTTKVLKSNNNKLGFHAV